LRSNGNIHPFPQMSVEKRVMAGCELAVVLVHPSPDPPIRYKGVTWIRVGPRRAVATVPEERRLAEKRRAGDLPFDAQPVPPARLDDLDLGLFEQGYLASAFPPDVLARNARSVEHQLASLRFATTQTPMIPTVLGLLVSGKDPTQYVPGAYVQFLRIDGLLLTDPIKDSRRLGGPLPDVLRALDGVFQAHVSVASDLTNGPIEVRRPDYPPAAFQQLARNAVLHRTYESTNAPVRITWFRDRIEIQSPGGPFGQVNRGNFGQPGITDYRNPHLAEAMKNLGYVQKFGAGIAIAREELKKNGNPPPEFLVEDAHVCVILRRAP
jgi:ATP-dependent DNA helicase RecG